MRKPDFLIPKRTKRFRGIHRKRRTRLQRWQEYLWPSMGLMRFFRYTELQIKRQKHTQHKAALGIAIGFFWGCIPLPGQLAYAMLTAWVLKGTILLTVLATFVSNPWTYPIFLTWNYQFGHWLMGHTAPPPMPRIQELLNIMYGVSTLLQDVALPIFIGGAVTGLMVAIPVYAVVRINLAKFQSLRTAHLQDRRRQFLAPRHGGHE